MIKKAYSNIRLGIEVREFDRYREKYDMLSFKEKKRIANIWLKKYPEQAHFSFRLIENWIRDIVPVPGRIIEIGGWRGDLAIRALSSFPDIECWHNYDLIEFNHYQKCSDPRYKLFTLNDYLWNKSLKYNYNALLATHMIEHINWNELCRLMKWIPKEIRTVFLEAPIPDDAENHSWKGDHSSHILEKGWNQVSCEILKSGFITLNKEGNIVISLR